MLGLHVRQNQLQHLVAGGRGPGQLLLPPRSLQDGQQVQQAQQHGLVRCEMGNLGDPAGVLSKTPVSSNPADHPQLLLPVTSPLQPGCHPGRARGKRSSLHFEISLNYFVSWPQAVVVTA